MLDVLRGLNIHDDCKSSSEVLLQTLRNNVTDLTLWNPSFTSFTAIPYQRYYSLVMKEAHEKKKI